LPGFGRELVAKQQQLQQLQVKQQQQLQQLQVKQQLQVVTVVMGQEGLLWYLQVLCQCCLVL
jgi:hypothetical protein